MTKRVVGIVLLAVIAMVLSPVSLQATEYVGATTDYVYYQEYIPYDEDEPEMPMLFRTTANLNLRQAPSRDSARLALIDRGRLVYVTDFRDGEWFAVLVNGQAGYMYAEFLSKVVETDANTEVTITAINGTVERLHWSEARQLTTAGTTLTIIDVRTGITWQMASFSNGNHSDVEPLTAADTAAMLQAWGGRWCWTPRPVHVIVGDRVLAASLNGMPHAGGPRQGNNMNGHVCLHFYGSRTHNGSRGHERDHQNAVNEAFNAGR